MICDNPFEPYLTAGLAQAGATVSNAPSILAIPGGDWDAFVLAINPSRNPPVDAHCLAHLSAITNGAPIVQFWGDVDRAASRSAGIRVVPADQPAPGHMGILLNALGPEPIIRLQCGGLRAAELVQRGAPCPKGGIAEVL